MTVAPAAATRSAAALPIPVDAPVMSTILPLKSCTTKESMMGGSKYIRAESAQPPSQKTAMLIQLLMEGPVCVPWQGAYP